MRGRELDRLLAVGAADDVDAGDELLGLGGRPVAEQRLPVADADRRGRLRVAARTGAAAIQRGTVGPVGVVPQGAGILLQQTAKRKGKELTLLATFNL